MAMGSFGSGFAEAFNQSYNTFRQARLEREQKEKDAEMGSAVAEAYGFKVATPAERAAAQKEGRLPAAPNALQQMGIQKTPVAPVVNTTALPVQTTEARQIAQNVAAPPEIPQLNTSLPTAQGDTTVIAPPQAALPAAKPVAGATPPDMPAPKAALVPTQEQARQPFVDFETSKKNALENKVAPDERFTTSAQFEKIALEAARQGKSDVALQMFQKAKETKLQVVGAQLLDYAMSNDAKGLESFLNDVNDGHDASIKMNPDGTVMFAYGNNPPRQFPSLEMVARMANSMMAQDPEGMYNIFKEKVSQERQDRLDKKDVERTDAAIAESKVGTKIKEAQLPFVGLQAQAELGLTKAQTTNAIESGKTAKALRLAANTPGVLSEKASTAWNAELARVQKDISDNQPDLKGAEREAAIQEALAPWLNNSPYGGEVLRAIQAQQGGGGDAPKPAAQPTALPKGPKITQDTPGAPLGRAMADAAVKTEKRYIDKWSKTVNPRLTNLRNQIKSNKSLSQAEIFKLGATIREQFPISIIRQYTTDDERVLFGITKSN